LVRQLPSIHRHYQLTPVNSRNLFNHKGWTKVIGFHTRNPAHRVHEYIQLSALNSSFADGLFISPVIGTKKSGDFQTDLIMRSYETLIANGIYPEGKVVLGGFSTYSRYCGPREMVFTMLCRKNMGCSHFIIGRDHAGVDDFYDPEENSRLLDSLGDLEIQPITFEEIGYSKVQNKFLKNDNSKDIVKISGTDVRETLRNNKELPDWFMRVEVQDMLRDAIEQGVEVFHQ
jgi:ATP sulfurylase